MVTPLVSRVCVWRPPFPTTMAMWQQIFILTIFLFCTNLIVCQPEGWRMVDRFYGFRYEITGTNIFNVNYEQAAKHEADLLGCFGWIQKSKFSNTLVGEARCNKIQGPKFQEWLSRGPNDAMVTNFQTKIYSDTKIRLHFSSFKILDDNRDTCFLDQPHQCPEFSSTSSSSSGAATSKSHTEL